MPNKSVTLVETEYPCPNRMRCFKSIFKYFWRYAEELYLVPNDQAGFGCLRSGLFLLINQYQYQENLALISIVEMQLNRFLRLQG